MNWYFSEQEIKRFRGGEQLPPVARPDLMTAPNGWFDRISTFFSRRDREVVEPGPAFNMETILPTTITLKGREMLIVMCLEISKCESDLELTISGRGRIVEAHG